MFKNWRTSLAGVVGGLPIIATALLAGDYAKALEGAALMLVGFLAKDFTVTGTGR